MKKYAIMNTEDYSVEEYVEEVTLRWSYRLGDKPYYFIEWKGDDGIINEGYGSYNYKNVIGWYEEYFVKFHGMTYAELAMFISDSYCMPYDRVVDESFSDYNMNDCACSDVIDSILTSYEIDTEEE